jgi:Uma2 family endonuclease
MVTTAQTINNAPSDGVPVIEVPFVILHNVSWQTYQALLADMGEHRAARLAYNRGILEIKMPSKLHEFIKRLLERIITTLTEELAMSVLSLGSTTFNREEAEQGVEPDSCFYIQNAERVNLEDEAPLDLPPDLVVEVDITSSSRSRLHIYKIMGVPEIWRYNRQGFTILQLHSGEYVECESSLTFPQISAEFLKVLIEQGKQAKDQNPIIRELRNWLQESSV